MRKLTDHVVSPVNDKLEIFVCDEPGAGGAHHDYRITLKEEDTMAMIRVIFQNGPIAEAGVNGVTHEALLAILIDRLRSFQAGPYPCAENMGALACLQQALDWLKQRTRARMERDVEGTMKP
ncbi:MAG: hypothetical protein WC829_18235 [Hyphomicrobium sp.]|jgi:hypothetical protein